MKKDFSDKLETDNKKNKCINCGREVKDLEKGCSYCNQRNRENIEQFNGEEDKITSKKNTIAYAFKTLAWVELIGGFILGCLISEDIFVMILIWVTYFIVFLFMFAISETIQILHDIRSKIYKQKK